MTLPRLDNQTARRVFLDRHALAEPPVGPAKGADLLVLIRRLGFVQVDSINTVERAHHMILWSRRQGYRPQNLRPLLERDRVLFEHWTHDASIIPTEHLHWWQDRFERNFIDLFLSATLVRVTVPYDRLGVRRHFVHIPDEQLSRFDVG